MKFGILIFPNFEELDVFGPWELLGAWKKYGKGPEQCLIVAQTTTPVICANGVSINPHVSFEQCSALGYSSCARW